VTDSQGAAISPGFGNHMNSTRVSQHFDAPREAVYRALLDPSAIAQWRFPEGMSCFVHEFQSRPHGRFRVSLTYDSPAALGKSAPHTDTYHGHFAELAPNTRVVEILEFETTNTAMQGVMTITTSLADARDGTELVAIHEGLPPGVNPADNEFGWQQALARLKNYLQQTA